MEQKNCHGCPKRKVGCHSTCEVYAKNRAILDERNRRAEMHRASLPAFKQWYKDGKHMRWVK